MSRNFSLLAVIISVLFLNTFAYEDDEYYCQNGQEFKICHRCKDLETEEVEISEEPFCPRKETDTKCRCDNIAIKKEDTFFGGPQCETEDDYEDNYCYVSEDSHCEDKELSSFATQKVKTSDIWYRGDVYISYEACENMDDELSTGSEEIIDGIQIKEDYLLDLENNNKSIKFNFSEPAYEEWTKSENFNLNYTKWFKEKNTTRTPQELPLHCEYQCARRNDKVSLCGAWSFDKVKKICTIHFVNACCGQLGKQLTNKSFVSGYICPHCSSTRNDCPCSTEDLQKSALNTGHSRGKAGGTGFSNSKYGTK